MDRKPIAGALEGDHYWRLEGVKKCFEFFRPSTPDRNADGMLRIPDAYPYISVIAYRIPAMA